jgi:hypothetical protein
VAAALAFAAGGPAATPGSRMAEGASAPRCSPGGDPVVLTGTAGPDQAQTYLLLPVEIGPGATRLEIAYTWEPVEGNVFDLGLWDGHGYRSPAGFRGWSGSRQGLLHRGQAPVHVQADSAERGYRPGPVEPGTWHVELGVAAVRREAPPTWRVEIRCLATPVGSATPPDPVDPAHVARAEPGWYHGDFHMHGFHSHPEAPDWERFVAHARKARLDFLPVTEYVTNRHWDELGAVQRAHADLVVWPGREVITYFGHAIVLGETPSTVEYRHGFENVTLAEVQKDAVGDGALFGIAHPTIFPNPPYPPETCRGCEFRLDDNIDWDAVHTIEVLTGPAVLPPAAPGAAPTANPFMQTAIDKWTGLLQRGHRITAVSGSDDKRGPGLGSSATAVYAEALSRSALVAAVRAGHAYVKARGVDASPSLELRAVADTGAEGTFGDTLVANRAEVTLTVRGGAGQALRVLRNGAVMTTVPIDADPFTHTFTAGRVAEEGPLGTFWGLETFDDVAQTTIANPVFLAGHPRPP